MAQGGTRQAKSDLEGVETREVSGVRRPAIGETFLVIKSEDGMGEMNGTPVAAAASDGEGDSANTDAESPKLILTGAAKQTLQGLIDAVSKRLSDIKGIVDGAAVDDSAMEVPGELVVQFADVANMIAETVSPMITRDGPVGAEDVEKANANEQGQPADGQVAKGLSTWSQEYIDSLCDWCFAYVEPSSTKDNDWRTMPLSNRHFPIRDHAGRLYLPGVIDAMEQIANATPPFMSESKKRYLLLQLAMHRIDEVMIVVRREQNVPPETVAEFAAICKFLDSMQSAIGGAVPAVGQTAPAATDANAQGATTPVTQGMPEAVQKAVAAVKAVYIKKSDGDPSENEGGDGKPVPVAPEAMRKACGELRKTLDAFEKALGGEGGGEGEAVQKSADNDAIAQLTSRLGELEGTVKVQKSELDRAKQDLAGAKVTIAKFSRQTPPSNVTTTERVEPVAKSAGSTAPVSDFNDPKERTQIAKSAGSTTRVHDFNDITPPANSTEVGPINDFNARRS